MAEIVLRAVCVLANPKCTDRVVSYSPPHGCPTSLSGKCLTGLESIKPRQIPTPYAPLTRSVFPRFKRKQSKAELEPSKVLVGDAQP